MIRKLLFLMMIVSLSFGTAPAKTVIKLGTTAPKGSNWYQILKEMGFLWQQATGGEVTLKILAGGKLGDESEMIKKMRIQQIQAAAISAAGPEAGNNLLWSHPNQEGSAGTRRSCDNVDRVREIRQRHSAQDDSLAAVPAN